MSIILYISKHPHIKCFIYYNDQKTNRSYIVQILCALPEIYNPCYNHIFLCLRHYLLITLSSQPCDTKSGATRSLSIASLSIRIEIHVSLDRVLPAVLPLIYRPRSTDQLAEKDILHVSRFPLIVFAYPEKRSTACQPP